MLCLDMTLLLAQVGKDICSENFVLQHSLRTGDEKCSQEALDFSNLYIALKIYQMRGI